MEEKTTLELVEQARKDNKVAFMTVEGLMSTTIDEILNQPVEGILYDLNRDYATIMTLAKNSKNVRWVNDLALSDLFKEVFNRYKKLEEENKALKENAEKSVQAEEPKPEVVKQPVKNSQTKYKEGFDTDIVFVI